MTTTTVACMPFSFVLGVSKVKASSTADGSAYFYAGHSCGCKSPGLKPGLFCMLGECACTL